MCIWRNSQDGWNASLPKSWYCSPLHLYSHSLTKWFGQRYNADLCVIVRSEKDWRGYAASPFCWHSDVCQSVQFLPAGECCEFGMPVSIPKKEIHSEHSLKHCYDIVQIENAVFRENVGQLWDRLDHTGGKCLPPLGCIRWRGAEQEAAISKIPRGRKINCVDTARIWRFRQRTGEVKD